MTGPFSCKKINFDTKLHFSCFFLCECRERDLLNSSVERKSHHQRQFWPQKIIDLGINEFHLIKGVSLRCLFFFSLSKDTDLTIERLLNSNVERKSHRQRQFWPQKIIDLGINEFHLIKGVSLRCLFFFSLPKDTDLTIERFLGLSFISVFFSHFFVVWGRDRFIKIFRVFSRCFG
jgi:hypothetical protein